MCELNAKRTSPSGRLATRFGRRKVRFEYTKSLRTDSISTPRKLIGPEVTWAFTLIVGRTSARQSGFALVHSGSVARTVPVTTGASLHWYCLSQRCALGVSRSNTLCRLKLTRLLALAKRVATFSSAEPPTLPSYRLASSRLSAKRGARQSPASATSRIASPFSPVMPLAKPLKSATYGASLAQYAQPSSVSGGDSALAKLPLSSTDSATALATVTWPSANLKSTRSGTAFVADRGAVSVTVAEPTFAVSVANPVMRSEPVMPTGSPRFNSIASSSSDPSGIVAPSASKAARPFISPGRSASPSSSRWKLGLLRKLTTSRHLAKPARRALNGLSFSESGSASGFRAVRSVITLAKLTSTSTEKPNTSPFNCFAVSVPVSARRNSPSGKLTFIGGRLVPASVSCASN